MKTPSTLKRTSYFSVSVAFLFLINSCVNQSGGGNGAGKIAAKDTLPKKVPVDTTEAKKVAKADSNKISSDRKFNDIARYIAGMKGLPGSPYDTLESDSVWIRFHKDFDLSWNQITIIRLKPMATWGASDLSSERKANLDIFYPLSGPDILHANAFFPNAKNYRLYALERNGALPDLNHMKTEEKENYLTAIYGSLQDIFKRSYFITKKMSSALAVDNVNGTLPLICIFLVRTGHEIINVQYFHLNDDGTETLLNKDSIGIHHNDLVKVYFKSDTNNSVQMVSYMKCDLSNNAYDNNAALKSFFTKMPQSVTYLKSASYLLHYAFFTSFKDLILSKSKAILEDDTGIPYKYLSNDKWTVTLYGMYTTPVHDFSSGVFQKDLLKAYQDTAQNKPRKLPFSLGYHWGSNKQNLIKAELKG